MAFPMLLQVQGSKLKALWVDSHGLQPATFTF